MKLVTVLVMVAYTVLLTGCLEPPVSESLDLRMLPGGASVVSVRVALRKPSDFNDSPKVQQRLESETRALEEGTDPWSARFAAAAATRAREVRDFEDGRLFRLTRHARLDAPDDLRAFLRDTGVAVSFERGDDWEELTILPGKSGRPTNAQRERVKSELATWTAGLAAYFAATADLYDYLDAHPDRARACLATLLTKPSHDDPLTDEESKLTNAVDDAMGECGRVLAAPPDEPYTIDELSRLVYDPFPAPIHLTVPGKVLEREGFLGDLEAPLAIPATSLWSAFERIEGRFIAPDLALAAWRQDIAGRGGEIDLEALVSKRRHASRPDAGEVRGAIEAELRGAPVYRVRWTPSEEGEGAPLPYDREP